jgi:hypothetical protein
MAMILFILAITIAGGITGYVLAGAGSGTVKTGTVAQKSDSSADEMGLSKDKAGNDQAEGVLKEGGIDGEGSHHLERDGGPTQNVYLTSSVIPLDEFVGKKVRVFGSTFQAEKAGWFMDVGRLEVIK